MGHNFDVLKPDSGFQSLYKERRDCFKSVFDYVCSNHANGRICAIYGLRRTGKTVLMEQCIEALPSDMKNKCRLITCSRKTDFYELTEYIKEEIEKGNRYFFIDEITYADGFQQIGEILANIFVGHNNARIVVTGTDSLGLSLPSHNTQYDRTIFVHTTYTSFAEYARITGCNSIDDYIKNGSVLVPDLLSDYYKTHEYIETSITENLIHSLEKSEGIRKYPAELTEIYEEDELKNAIERIINKYSQDLSAKAIRNVEKMNQDIAQSLGILKNDAVCVNITEAHKQAVYEFLKEMDVFLSIPVYNSYITDEKSRRLETISHPGICHSNIKQSLSALKDDSNWLKNVTRQQKERLIKASYETACGNLMENIIITDVYYMLCNGKDVCQEDLFGENTGRWYVSKINRTINNRVHEADIIIFDKEKKDVYLFEIKHSTQNIPEQSRHLEDEAFLKYIKDNFGPVKGRAVLYNGETTDVPEVPRISAADFLIQMYRDTKTPGFSPEQTLKMLSPCNIGELKKEPVLSQTQECMNREEILSFLLCSP